MIKFLVMDVDGSLTDGKIHMGVNGEAFKSFSIKDGCGIKDIIPQYGVIPVIITARESEILANRCRELGIIDIYQNVRQKLDKLKEMISDYSVKENVNYSLGDCAYFGDDILDIQCMRAIKEAGGNVGCPSDAIQEVRAISDYVCINKAGEGALREFSDWLIKPRVNEKDIDKRVTEAIEFLQKLTVTEADANQKIIVNKNFFYNVQNYETKEDRQCKLESHRCFVDIQIMVRGSEAMDIVDTSRLTVKEEYDIDKDVMYWNVPHRMARTTLRVGDCIVLYPENAHRGAISIKKDEKVLKIVGKVRI